MRGSVTGVVLWLSTGLASTTRADDIKVEFLNNGTQTITVGADRPGALLVDNPTSHRFKCDHLTQGLRVVVTPAAEVDVALQVEHAGRKPRRPIDRRRAGGAERYSGHPPLGATTIHVRSRSGEGDVVVAWTWNPKCCERCKVDVPEVNRVR